jgi:hypothetical protein
MVMNLFHPGDILGADDGGLPRTFVCDDTAQVNLTGPNDDV